MATGILSVMTTPIVDVIAVGKLVDARADRRVLRYRVAPPHRGRGQIVAMQLAVEQTGRELPWDRRCLEQGNHLRPSAFVLMCASASRSRSSAAFGTSNRRPRRIVGS